ncbi:MAG: mechanosensitive ion channel [Gammaproteobacteria bacterium]|nr:mechanosensitive ion channel [Gammaproteobacteria bacterium]
MLSDLNINLPTSSIDLTWLDHGIGKILSDLLFYEFFTIGDSAVTSVSLLQGILIMAITILIARYTQTLFLRLNTAANGKVPPAVYTIIRVLFYIIIIVGLVTALSSVGINFTNLAIVAGALSVGVGFGLQSVVNNFVSGIIILFEHNVKVGDFIELDSGLRGTVKDINVRSTIVTTPDNLDIIVPNSELISTKVTNYTLNESIVRIHIPFGVAYGTDKEQVRNVVLAASRNLDITYDDGDKRRPQVWLVGFGDNSLDFELVIWLNPKNDSTRPGSWNAMYMWEIETALSEAGIEIPFPQRDLHIKSDSSELLFKRTDNNKESKA